MLLRISFFFSFILMFLISACTPKHSEIVLAEFGDNQIKMDEFERAYAKNAGGIQVASNDSVSQYEKFLNLYVNFKMKLRDAEVRGLFDRPDIRNELTDYQKKVGASYILEKELVEPAIRNLYEKRKEELRVSHIMFRTDPSNSDSVKEFAQQVLDSILSGAATFEQMVKYSQDSFSKPEAGDIFYITAGQLPVEFEDAAYELKKGQIYPELVQTRYGFHIIKVTDRQPRIEKIKASHILIDFNNEEGIFDSVAAREKIDSIHTELINGADFAQLASELSEDPGSKTRGGDLGFFERRMMVKPFDEAAFKLDVGEISDVVKTQFGYHIIKVTDKQPVRAFELSKDDLKKIYKQTRYNQDYEKLIDSLKNAYHYSLNESAVQILQDTAVSYKFGQEHPDSDQLSKINIFRFTSDSVTVTDFLDRAGQQTEFASKDLNPALLQQAIDKFSGEYTLELAAMDLPKHDSTFAELMEDYKKGILVFELQEEEVWNKIEIDSTKLYEFYLQTKENYRFPDRVNFSEIYAKTDSAINYYYSLLQQGENFDSVASKYTERLPYRQKAGNFGWQNADQSEFAKVAFELENPGDYSKPFRSTGGYSIVKLNQKDPARIKTFEEARPEVSGAYQEALSERLEQEYLESLKNRYEPEFYYEELKHAFKTE